MPYAETTEVPVAKTKAEIEKLLEEKGASAVLTGHDSTTRTGVVQYRLHGKFVRHYLKLPDRQEFERTPKGKLRYDDSQIGKAWDMGTRARWRQLLLILRAKFVAVESGISTFEEEFLANLVLTDNTTFGQWAVPQIEDTYRTGKMPPMLPEPR